MEAMTAVERLLTPEDVSELLGIPVKTLANWRSERVTAARRVDGLPSAGPADRRWISND
jgi:hypothetical protein